METIKNKLTLISLTPLMLSLLMSVFILILNRFLPPRLPLFYSLPWGEAQLVNQGQILIIPATIAGITLLNLIIDWQLHPSQILFKYILMYASLISSIILTLSFIKIVFIFI